jgi:signal transduction histidine kinase
VVVRRAKKRGRSPVKNSAGLLKRLRQAHNQAQEALAEQTATAEILKVTSGSPGQVQPVLQAILTSASRLCEASFAAVFHYDGEMLSNVAQLNASDRFAQFLQQLRARPSRETTTRRCALERRTIHTADLLNDPEFSPPEHQRRENVRTALSVPMMREDRLIGVITLWRNEVRPFSDKQVALVQTFADQALIAIENVRLFNETKEALEQQTATSEILRVISGSPTDVQPVFEAIVQSGVKLFEGAAVAVARPENGQVRLMAIAERDPEQAQKWRARFPFPLTREYMHSAAILDCKTVEMPDVQVMDGQFDAGKRNFAPSGYRAMTVVPMVKDGAAVGTISVIRKAPGPLSDKQVSLLKTFADQAVIAIQNARLFREIHEKSRQLEIANQHKSEFLANMSHELRTPLNAIIGFTRIVMRRSQEQLDPEQYENLEKILASGQHLLALINAILDLSKVEAGHVQVNPSEIPLAPVLESCVRTVEPLVKTDAVTLLKEFNGELPQLYLDEEKLRQIVINLLSNAVKFTASGSIRLQAHAANGSVAIAVADTGIGIAADKLGLIFEEFEQADASSTRVYGGTGLGLAIARRLARLMGGDIAVQSTLGSGSTFTLTLPVRYQAQA